MTGDDLLARLRRVIEESDPVPEQVRAAARDAWTWRDPDAALARLISDSLTGTAPVRGGDSRLLSYHAGETVVEVEVTEIGQAVRVVGQVVPPQPARVRIEHPGGAGGGWDGDADALGRFAAGGLRRGPARIILTLADGQTVGTEWTLF